MHSPVSPRWFACPARAAFIVSDDRLRSAPLNPAELSMRRLAPVLALIAALVALGGPVSAADLENTIYMDVPAGRVVIEMRPDLAPRHVAQIKELARRGFYNGVAFHRVIDGFMAQTGDPKGDGTGGSGKKIPAEFNGEKHVRGTVSMARSQSPDSADS